jgi:hypothetical protein
MQDPKAIEMLLIEKQRTLIGDIFSNNHRLSHHLLDTLAIPSTTANSSETDFFVSTNTNTN